MPWSIQRAVYLHRSVCLSPGEFNVFYIHRGLFYKNWNVLYTHRGQSPEACCTLTTSAPSSVQFSFGQFKMVSLRSEKPICTPPRLSEVSPASPLKRFQCSSGWRWLSLVFLSQGRSSSTSSFHASLLLSDLDGFVWIRLLPTNLSVVYMYAHKRKLILIFLHICRNCETALINCLIIICLWYCPVYLCL